MSTLPFLAILFHHFFTWLQVTISLPCQSYYKTGWPACWQSFFVPFDQVNPISSYQSLMLKDSSTMTKAEYLLLVLSAQPDVATQNLFIPSQALPHHWQGWRQNQVNMLKVSPGCTLVGHSNLAESSEASQESWVVSSVKRQLQWKNAPCVFLLHYMK